MLPAMLPEYQHPFIAVVYTVVYVYTIAQEISVMPLMAVVKIEKFYHSILITFDTDLDASTLAPPPETCSGQTWDRFTPAFANLTR